MKNIPIKEVFRIAEQTDYLEGQVVSKTLAQNGAVSITVFSFDKGEEISTHESKGDAFVTVVDGTARITVEGDVFIVKKGESIVMPANKPHALFAEDRFKMILTVVFPVDSRIQIG